MDVQIAYGVKLMVNMTSPKGARAIARGNAIRKGISDKTEPRKDEITGADVGTPHVASPVGH